jgi:hypothetical protein
MLHVPVQIVQDVREIQHIIQGIRLDQTILIGNIEDQSARLLHH